MPDRVVGDDRAELQVDRPPLPQPVGDRRPQVRRRGRRQLGADIQHDGDVLPRHAGCSDDGRIVRVDVGGVQRPGELELDLLVLLAALVLDRELGADGDLEPLTGDLDAERLVLLQGIGQPPQLGYQLRGGVDALDVTSTLSFLWRGCLWHLSRSE